MENGTWNSTTTANATTVAGENAQYLTGTQQGIVTVVYIMGLLGNALALAFLIKRTTRPNNPKHRLMLRCLATNDFCAILGMLSLMYAQIYFPAARRNVWFCRARVVMRVFGLGSGSLALVMAVERWFAFTRPFFYQKHVTVLGLKRSILTLWTSTIVLGCLPLFGFGLYYEWETKKCVRYKMAKLPIDVAYAYLYFAIGVLLCAGIVFCNVAVMNAFCCRKNDKRLMRRMTRTCSKMSTASTREETAFGRLMLFLCVIFLGCWLPQLIGIPLAQFHPNNKNAAKFGYVADMLMALHFVLDPYVYVMQRWPVFSMLFCSNSRNQRRNRVLSTKVASACEQMSNNAWRNEKTALTPIL